MSVRNTEITVPLSPVEEPDAVLAAAIALDQEEEQRQIQQSEAEEYETIDAKYSIDHLAAVVRPVMITMILASLAVIYVRDQSSGLSSGLDSYLVKSDSSTAAGSGGGSSGGGGSSPTGTDISNALINALVIVGVVCGATFVLVACYYFRCLKVMLAYLMFAMTSLLGYTGTFLVSTALTVWKVPADWPTLVFVMANFAVVGVWSVFYQKGVPRNLTQMYLVCVAVIMSWVLTQLPEWTSWALLVVLALYDLCAVLTPCGPLKWLVALAQERRDPIPGLLYEANVGGSGDREGVRDTFVTGEGRARAGDARASSAAVSGQGQARPTVAGPTIAVREALPTPTPIMEGTAVAGTSATPATPHARHSSSHGVAVVVNPAHATPKGGEGEGAAQGAYTALPATSPSEDGRSGSSSTGTPAANVRDWGLDAARAASAVQVVAGHIHPQPPLGQLTQAQVEEQEQEEEDEEGGGSIKLGLGDFVFYSVLVSRAAMYDASTLAACFVAVIAGLGGTLFLLSLMRKALPALPISIFMGVVVYLATRFAVTPMLEQLVLHT